MKRNANKVQTSIVNVNVETLDIDTAPTIGTETTNATQGNLQMPESGTNETTTPPVVLCDNPLPSGKNCKRKATQANGLCLVCSKAKTKAEEVAKAKEEEEKKALTIAQENLPAYSRIDDLINGRVSGKTLWGELQKTASSLHDTGQSRLLNCPVTIWFKQGFDGLWEVSDKKFYGDRDFISTATTSFIKKRESDALVITIPSINMLVQTIKDTKDSDRLNNTEVFLRAAYAIGVGYSRNINPGCFDSGVIAPINVKNLKKIKEIRSEIAKEKREASRYAL